MISRGRFVANNFVDLSLQSKMSGQTLFERCAVENDGDQALMLQCVANNFEQQTVSDTQDMDKWLLVLAGALVFFMQASVLYQVSRRA